MKNFLIGLCFLGLTSSVFAQDVIYSAKVKEKQVPEEVVTAVEKDFKGFSVVEYKAVPVTIVEDKVTITDDKDFDPSKYDSYQVTLLGKGTSMQANYDADGKLLSTFESIKDKALPIAVDRAIIKKYPNATIESDRYVATHFENNGKTTVHYHVKIKNNGKIHRMYVDGNGNIIRG